MSGPWTLDLRRPGSRRRRPCRTYFHGVGILVAELHVHVVLADPLALEGRRVADTGMSIFSTFTFTAAGSMQVGTSCW